jgi:flagellar P-ring protein precursor FlgI
VSQGSLSVRVDENTETTQGTSIVTNGDQTVAVPSAPVTTQDSTVTTSEDIAKAFLFDDGVTLSSLVDTINQVGATTSDLVAILEALREAGALNAELIII